VLGLRLSKAVGAGGAVGVGAAVPEWELAAASVTVMVLRTERPFAPIARTPISNLAALPEFPTAGITVRAFPELHASVLTGYREENLIRCSRN
jgi:hypothetical protein